MHGCISSSLAHYRKGAAKLTDSALTAYVKKCAPGGAWHGTESSKGKRGGDYDTISWRLYKLAHRQEAHKRGLGT